MPWSPASEFGGTDTDVKTYIFQARFPGWACQARREINATTPEGPRHRARMVGSDQAGDRPGADRGEGKGGEGAGSRQYLGCYRRVLLHRQAGDGAIGSDHHEAVPQAPAANFEATPIAEITDPDILGKVINPIKANTKATARQRFNDLYAFFEWAIDQRIYGLKLNPCSLICRCQCNFGFSSWAAQITASCGVPVGRKGDPCATRPAPARLWHSCFRFAPRGRCPAAAMSAGFGVHRAHCEPQGEADEGKQKLSG